MGLDSECDVTIDAALSANRGVEPTIRRLRESLIAEHLGVEPGGVARLFDRSGSLIETIEPLRGDGRLLELPDLVAPVPFDAFIASTAPPDPPSPHPLFPRLPHPALTHTSPPPHPLPAPLLSV